MDGFSAVIHLFHFLRPWWLLLIIPAIAAALLVRYHTSTNSSWTKVIDPELLPFLLDNPAAKQRSSAWIWFSFWIFGSLAMAGPTWEKIPLPIHKSQQPLVILIDLSPSMMAQDIKPDRQTRAKLKLIDLLKMRQEGTTSLVSYAGEAFVVSPLTDDSHTIANMVNALHPNIMPVPGSNTEQAVAQAIKLIENTRESKADILLITDEVTTEAADEINTLLRTWPDIQLSILGIGTPDGGPIPLGQGGFAKDQNGNIVIPTLNKNRLKKLAQQHGGRYVTLRPDNRDLEILMQLFESNTSETTVVDERTTDVWHDLGYWLLIPMMLLLAPLFSRGSLIALAWLPILSASMFPQQAQAMEWKDLWLTKDQQAARAFQQGNPTEAQSLFKDQDWKAASAYKSGDYQTAAKLYQGDTATQHYNRGNSLAKSGRLEEALDAYNQVLKKNPEFKDAQTAKNLVEQLLKQQQQQQQQQQQNGPQDSPDSQSQQGNDSQNPNPPENQDEQGNQQQNQAQSQQQKPGNSSKDSRDNKSGDNQDNSPTSGDDAEQTPQDKQSTAKQNQNTEQPDKSEQLSNPENPTQPSQNQHSENDHAKGQNDDTENPPNQGSLQAMPDTDPLSDEEKQTMEQWLRKIPDDPGGLLREKFYYESQKRAQEQQRGLLSPQEQQQRW